VATRLVIPSPAGDDFEQAFNEAFEQLLIARWHGPARMRSQANAVIAERADSYQVRISAPGANPREMEVEVNEWRLTVRLPAKQGRSETVFEFSHRVDVERTRARFESEVLEIRVPKNQGRRIKID
jgi:HSP20 family molecular chaperone IbpA